MYQILSERESLNHIASRLNGRTPGVFTEISLGLPRIEPAELGFIRVVSWLYVLYYEAGKIGTKFLVERIETLSPEHTAIKDHYYLIGKLRTYLQHNLDPSKSHDYQIQRMCEAWFLEECGSQIPSSEAHWGKCLSALLTAALQFLKALVATVRIIETDESKDAIVDEWVYALDRYHAPHEFDAIIGIVCREMGREYIEPAELRRRFYDRWTKEMQVMKTKYDFAMEARKLIEHTLLTETIPVLPITGSDVIRHFGIQPGPRVGALLQIARRLYDQEPCSAQELLLRVENHSSE